MINVTCKLETYGDEATPQITINNHWNNGRLVEIVIEDKKVIVSASEIKAAVENCTNTAKY